MSAKTDEPIRHAVILTHPDRHSFNVAIVGTYCDTVREYGQEVVLRDLYRMRFNPVLKKRERPGSKKFRVSPDVAAELDAVKGSDIFTFIYPIWFGMPPAMMKGYVDRVIGSGITARQIEARQGEGLLSAAHLACITTSGAPDAWLDEQGQIEALREISSRYLFRAFAMKSAEAMHIGSVVDGMSKRTANRHLRNVRERAKRICVRLATERGSASSPTSVGDGS